MEKIKLYREPGKVYINIYKSYQVKKYPEKYELVNPTYNKKGGKNEK